MWNVRVVTDAIAPSVAVVTVSYNTLELTALLLWSLYRVLDWPALEVVVIDNASTDGSAALLAQAALAGICTTIPLNRNVGHGLGLNEGIRHLRERREPVDRIWILDSDCVVARPDVLSSAFASPAGSAAIVGESHWDRWQNRTRFDCYSLIIDSSALGRDVGEAPFTDGGDPSLSLLVAAETAGLRLAEFPFTTEHYLVHRGRGSLAAVVASDDRAHPMYEWAVEHHEPHFGGVPGAADIHAELVTRFQQEVAQPIASGLVAALGRVT